MPGAGHGGTGGTGRDGPHGSCRGRSPQRGPAWQEATAPGSRQGTSRALSPPTPVLVPGGALGAYLGAGGCPPPALPPGPGAWRQQDLVQAALTGLLGPRCSASPHPPPPRGAWVASPAAERGVGSGRGASPRLSCDEPARAQHPLGHDGGVGNPPSPVAAEPGSRSPRPRGLERVLACPSRLGWHQPRRCSPGTKPHGGAFGTRHRARHCTAGHRSQPAPTLPPSRTARERRAGEGTRCLADASCPPEPSGRGARAGCWHGSPSTAPATGWHRSPWGKAAATRHPGEPPLPAEGTRS